MRKKKERNDITIRVFLLLTNTFSGAKSQSVLFHVVLQTKGNVFIVVIPNTAVFGPTKLIGTMTTTMTSTIPPG